MVHTGRLQVEVQLASLTLVVGQFAAFGVAHLVVNALLYVEHHLGTIVPDEVLQLTVRRIGQNGKYRSTYHLPLGTQSLSNLAGSHVDSLAALAPVV